MIERRTAYVKITASKKISMAKLRLISYQTIIEIDPLLDPHDGQYQ